MCGPRPASHETARSRDVRVAFSGAGVLLGPRVILLTAMMLFGVGCESVREITPPPIGVSEAEQAQHNGYTLLYQLLSKNRDVNKLLWIKAAPPTLKELIEDAADLSGEAADGLEPWLGDDVDRSDPGLPEAEKAVRQLMEDRARQRLLSSSGPPFQRQLALEQLSAMDYAAALCRVLAKWEPDPGRTATVEQWADRFEALADRFRGGLHWD